MPFARASELDRLLACPGSLVLPRTNEKSERAVQAAEWGTLVHKWKETGDIPSGRLGTVLKKKLKETNVSREGLFPEGVHELPLAYNVVSSQARALVLPVSESRKDEWKAAHGDEWITGTADFVGLLLDTPWIDDLKTGRLVYYDNYRYQQGFYALAWILFSEGRLTPVRSTITHWPKYPIPKKPDRFGTVLEVEFFQEMQDRLRQLREVVMKLRDLDARGGRDSVVAQLRDGEQCKYCPSKLACIKGQKYE